MTHSIETICLPTYHKFDVIKIDDDEKTPPAITILSDTDYATKAKFMEAVPTYSKSFSYPEDESTINIDLYRIENSTFDPETNPIEYDLFSARSHVAPNVLWFQPYNKSSQSIELSLTIGLKIIQNELDGIIIPLPNINEDLTTNNSFYLQGSVPIYKVNSFIPSEDANSILRLQKRRTHTRTSQPMGFSIRNSTINALPVLGSKWPTRSSTRNGLSTGWMYDHHLYSCTRWTWDEGPFLTPSRSVSAKDTMVSTLSALNRTTRKAVHTTGLKTIVSSIRCINYSNFIFFLQSSLFIACTIRVI